MTSRLWLLAFSFLSGAVAHGQDPAAVKPIQIRAILQDPGNPVADFYIPTQAGTTAKLNLAVEGLVAPQASITTDGALNLYKSAVLDTTNPKAGLAASAKVPAGATRLIALLVPAPSGTTPPYRMAFIDDDPKTFRWGESRVVNLTSVDFAVEVGEHKIKVPGGKITELPEVKKLNEYSQAQTNFYYQNGEAWDLAAEKQLPFLNSIRRIFLIYKTPEAISPDIRTIMDNVPVEIPKAR